MPLFAQAETDRKGNFEMEGLRFYEGESVIKAKTQKGKTNLMLEVQNANASNFPENVKPVMLFDRGTAEEVTENFTKKSQQRRQIELAYDTTGVRDLGTVVVKADANEQRFQDLKRGILFNQGEYSLSANEIMKYGRVPQNAVYLLQGSIPGIWVRPDRNGEATVDLGEGTGVLIFLDDGIYDLSAIASLAPQLIERIEIMKPDAAMQRLGAHAHAGAIFFYTKTNAEQEQFQAMMADKFKRPDLSTKALPAGYYKGREFYEPIHDPDKPSPKPDYRDLIHWAPMIQTDENGEAQVAFYNADLSTTIRVQLEGIWAGGIPLVAHTTYQVKN